MTPLTYSTPGLLFPAISLLMLAYTNRFLGLASLARHLIARYREEPHPRLKLQVENLRQRLALLRHTQALGVLSLLSCTASLFGLLFDHQPLATALFALALILMLASLALSLREIYLSVRALNVELDDLMEPH
ncbi:DUF2721 domain-containing protein [Solimonas sp. K1W22B-7]|uniref:DUF2721 domain-containing protein n=1 Tax=Solimonas sp. K1W22B-7 TaxID=2303331 RepID=UPI000E32DDDA|nr:DUF2721 domain-containing protein [Solimonas sp. K1W22B-7]AXQ28419.1 DUF2721 domain-containing protein [Solimonas sp. K1W22B-7]